LFEAQLRSDWTVAKSAQGENLIDAVKSIAVHYSPTTQPDMAKFLEKSNQFRFYGASMVKLFKMCLEEQTFIQEDQRGYIT